MCTINGMTFRAPSCMSRWRLELLRKGMWPKRTKKPLVIPANGEDPINYHNPFCGLVAGTLSFYLRVQTSNWKRITVKCFTVYSAFPGKSLVSTLY